jgi:hypothetical protein
MLLGGKPRGSCRGAPALLAEKLTVVAVIRQTQRGVLRMGELDVSHPPADRALRDADALRDQAYCKALISSELAGECPLPWFHEHMFA